jgi:hypothetical protein
LVWEGNGQTKKSGSFTRIEGYRPKANSFQEEGFSTILFSGKKQFETVFEKIPGAKPGKMSFDGKAVVACFGKKTNTETALSLDKISKRDGVMEVYFKAVYGKKMSSGILPSCLYNIVVDRSLSGINYYINGKLVQELRN